MFLWSTIALAGWPALEPEVAAAPVDGSDDSALIIGISDYLLVPDVPGATENTQDWYDYLVDARGLPSENVRYLRDSEANDGRITRMAEEVAGVGTGRVWAVFVGHGAPALDGKDGLLVGVDASGDPETLADRSVRRDELLATLASTGRPVTAILDTCFSGTTAAGEPLAPSLQPLVPSYAEATVPPAVSVATAAASDQFAGPLPDSERPAFSYLVLGAAQGWGDADGDGTISLQEAVDYAGATLQAEVVDRRQTPSLIGPGDLTLGAGLQVEPVRSRRADKATKERKGPRRLGWKITTGVLAASTATFAGMSIHNRSLVDRNVNPDSITTSWRYARTYGGLAYTAGAATGTTFLISVL